MSYVTQFNQKAIEMTVMTDVRCNDGPVGSMLDLCPELTAPPFWVTILMNSDSKGNRSVKRPTGKITVFPILFAFLFVGVYTFVFNSVYMYECGRT